MKSRRLTWIFNVFVAVALMATAILVVWSHPTPGDVLTALLVIGTWALASFTRDLIEEQRESTRLTLERQSESSRAILELQRAEIGTRFYLSQEEKFDGSPVRVARARLARRLQDEDFVLTSALEEGADFDSLETPIPEDVLDFFETTGYLVGRGIIDEELASQAFGWYAPRWWHETRNYVLWWRRVIGDPKAWENFQLLAERLLAREASESAKPENQLRAEISDGSSEFLENEIRQAQRLRQG